MSERTANCPNCGAEIVFRWSGAVQTSCPACKSVLVRHDLDLEKVGEIGDVPPAMSRIQLGTEGRYKGKPFEVVGRIVYKWERGHWSEWYLRMPNDESAWLSDAQGEYAVTRAIKDAGALPSVLDMVPGGTLVIDGRVHTIASITRARYSGVEGELPFEYWDKLDVDFVDLKADEDTFATIDYSDDPPLVFAGEYEEFDELKLRNLAELTTSPDAMVGKVKGLNCTKCGAAIELRMGDLAQTVACSACTAILDATDPNYAILEKSQQKRRAEPKIPLGRWGELKGEKCQVVGFRVASITVEGVEYAWREYVLWNGQNGFRYLTEYEGHWNDVAVIKGVPRAFGAFRQPMVEYLGTRFKHFQHAVASTRFVLGEFPWEVRTGDQVEGDDFVAPPLMLSREKSASEVTWSLGTYTQPERIAEAFKLKDPLPKPVGVFANQPSPQAGKSGAYAKTFLLLAAALIAVWIGRFAIAKREQVFTQSYEYTRDSAGGSAFVTPEFDLRGGTSNIEIRIATSLDNDWAFFNLALLSSEGGRGYELGREVSYYHGYDSDGSWSEGSKNDRAVLGAIPAGRYYLRIEPERDVVAKPFTYRITVTRDVPRMFPFVIGFVLLLLPPIFVWIRAASFESTRWAESDYAPVSSDDDDDDDDE